MISRSKSIDVLYVDGDAESANVVAEGIEQADNQITAHTVTSPDDAFSILARRNVDYIISAYAMPGTDGVAFLHRVRDQHPDIPFILYTDNGSEAVAAEAISSGVTDYLRKQSDDDQYTTLATRIRRVVDSYQPQERLTQESTDLWRYKRMVNSMREAACIYTKDGRFELVNEYLADWYGTTREALRGEPSALIDHVREQASETDPYEELLSGERDQLRGELASEFPDHGYAVLEYRLTPLELDGTIEGVVGIARDITTRKEYEEQLEEQNERLEEFASVVSHDLRNPLNVAQGRLELVKEECDSPHLAPIERSHTRMETLIEDLLTLARQGDVITDMETVDPSDLASTCWANVDTAAATVVIETDQTVWADPSSLKQVFENLIRNAIEHGDTSVSVTFGELSDGFYIEDDGPGIPPDEQDDVFEPGYTTSSDGTGFGLRIVKEIVEAHDWTLRLTEGNKGGARFEITGVEFADD